MLGEKRSRNLFAEDTGSKASEDKVPEAKVSEPEVPAAEEQVPECSDHSAPQNQEAPAMIHPPTKREPSVRHALFFEKEETRSFLRYSGKFRGICPKSTAVWSQRMGRKKASIRSGGLRPNIFRISVLQLRA